MNILPILHLRRSRFLPGGIRHSRARRPGEADNLWCPGNNLSLKTAVFKDNHLLKLYLVLENGCFQGQGTKESVDFLDFKRVRMYYIPFLQTLLSNIGKRPGKMALRKHFGDSHRPKELI